MGRLQRADNIQITFLYLFCIGTAVLFLSLWKFLSNNFTRKGIAWPEILIILIEMFSHLWVLLDLQFLVVGYISSWLVRNWRKWGSVLVSNIGIVLEFIKPSLRSTAWIKNLQILSIRKQLFVVYTPSLTTFYLTFTKLL